MVVVVAGDLPLALAVPPCGDMLASPAMPRPPTEGPLNNPGLGCLFGVVHF